MNKTGNSILIIQLQICFMDLIIKRKTTEKKLKLRRGSGYGVNKFKAFRMVPAS